MRTPATYTAIVAATMVASAGFSLARLGLAMRLLGEGAPAPLVSSLAAAFMAGRASSAWVSGLLAGRGRPIAGYTLLATTLTALAATATPAQLAPLLLAAWGLLNGLAWPQVQIAVARLAGRKGSGPALSIYFALGGVGTSLGYMVYGYTPSDPEACILGALLIAASSITISYTVHPIVKQHAYSRRQPSRPRSRGSRVRLRGLDGTLLGLALLSGYAGGLLAEPLYTLLATAYNMPRTMLGYGLAVVQAVGVTALLAAGPLTAVKGAAPTAKTLLAVAAASPIPTIVSPTPEAAIASASLMAVTGRAASPVTRNPHSYSSRGEELVGVANTLSNIGSIVAPLAAAVAQSAGAPLAPILVLTPTSTLLLLLASIEQRKPAT